MDPDQAKLTKDEAIKRELQRKSLDSIKVKNPLNEDYIVYWDKYPHRVSATGEAVLPRYIATKYVREMTDMILTQRSDQAVKDENARRIKKGHAAMNKHEEQLAFEINYAINKPELRKPVIQMLWGGVVSEYGRDMELPQATRKPQDTRPLDEQLLDEIEGLQPVTEVEVTPQAPAEDLAQEITNDD